MFTAKKRFFVFTLAGALVFTGTNVFFSHSAKGYSSGAPAGFCGAPGDGNNCTYCHSSFPVQTVTGAITSDIPAAGYQPGGVYTFTATISGPGHTRFGFQISPQDETGNLIGSMDDLGPETTFTGLGKYITHSPTGTSGTGTRSWQFEWTAPAAGSDSVTFYGAFNVTNDDGGPVGDSIFLATYTVYEATTNSATDMTAFLEDVKIWQDANHALQVAFVNRTGETCELTVYDLQGKMITENTVSGSGRISQTLNMQQASGGVYLLAVRSGERTFSKTFIYNTAF
jgi:hypothetical protein